MKFTKTESEESVLTAASVCLADRRPPHNKKAARRASLSFFPDSRRPRLNSRTFLILERDNVSTGILIKIAANDEGYHVEKRELFM